MTDDPTKRPVSRELEILMPTIAETMKLATQALCQSTALAQILIQKGVLTQAELDTAMPSVQKLRGKLVDALNEHIKKQS